MPLLLLLLLEHADSVAAVAGGNLLTAILSEQIDRQLNLVFRRLRRAARRRQQLAAAEQSTIGAIPAEPRPRNPHSLFSVHRDIIGCSPLHGGLFLASTRLTVHGSIVASQWMNREPRSVRPDYASDDRTGRTAWDASRVTGRCGTVSGDRATRCWRLAGGAVIDAQGLPNDRVRPCRRWALCRVDLRRRRTAIAA